MNENNLSNKDVHQIITFLDENNNECEEKDATHGRFLIIDSQGNRIEEGLFICNNKDDEVVREEPKKVVEPERVKISKYIMEKRYYYDENDNSCTKDNASYEVIEIYKMGLLLDRYTVNLNKEDNLDFTRYTGK